MLLSKLPKDLRPAAKSVAEAILNKKPILDAVLTASRDKKAARGISIFISKIRNWLMIKFFKVNPCAWECFCKRMIIPLSNFEYQTSFHTATLGQPGSTFAQQTGFGRQSYVDWTGRKIGFVLDFWNTTFHKEEETQKGAEKFMKFYWTDPSAKKYRESPIDLVMTMEMFNDILKWGTFPRSRDTTTLVAMQSRKSDNRVTCAAVISYAMVFCSTCCCKYGLVQTLVKSKLVIDNKNCAMWFTFADMLIRTWLSAARMLFLANIMPKCYNNKTTY